MGYRFSKVLGRPLESLECRFWTYFSIGQYPYKIGRGLCVSLISVDASQTCFRTVFLLWIMLVRRIIFIHVFVSTPGESICKAAGKSMRSSMVNVLLHSTVQPAFDLATLTKDRRGSLLGAFGFGLRLLLLLESFLVIITDLLSVPGPNVTCSLPRARSLLRSFHRPFVSHHRSVSAARGGCLLSPRPVL